MDSRGPDFPRSQEDVADSSFERKRRTFRWSAQARELVNANLKASGYQLRRVVMQLVEMTGHPRSACRRFVYRMGNKGKTRHKKWPMAEQQRLLELLDKYTIGEAAQRMRCSKSAVYGMLRRLKIPAKMRQDFISKSQLATMLRVHIYQVNSWIQSGWLKATVMQIGEVTRTVIKPDDFFQFCQEHREAVIGNRLNLERLEFIYKYVFPPDHNHLLSVREHKKERAAFDTTPTATPAEDESEAGSWPSEDSDNGERSVA